MGFEVLWNRKVLELGFDDSQVVLVDNVWLIKVARGELQDWLCPIVNSSLQLEHMPVILKETIICPIPKKPDLDPTGLQLSIFGQNNQDVQL